ncbi:penicillin acylase family protein [Actinomycetospora sp. TBRC 11914]|uniref:penicillin acylase family protein n=1 Tax=Actinomycetospora sp. TBRC 11914 TaxID=2729387 RepID=UPI00145DF4A5|nr:penicillin acylase family protein [Actinomycetospora sp. TBRC 11914]NMO88399.1 penicillin acylase family protein [Actinomycetospora sp. TBRC 11914]
MAALPSSELPVAGLRGEVEVLVDRWGIPHVYAGSAHDAYVAQGFQAARDRLFQIDLWRRRGLGRLAEVFGPRHLDGDRARRLFLYRGGMDAEWASYAEGTREIVEAFVAGVNAGVDWALAAPEERLPPEFAALGHLPARWSPDDVVRIRTHGLLYNAEQELARALTVRDLGPAAEELRAIREPGGPLTVPDAGILDALRDEVLDVYRLAFAPAELAPEPAVATAPSGSNNWVVSAARSGTGRPLLANDPHRAVTVPSLRYLAHLEAPGLSVIGAGEPNLPGISLGHNDRVAFGLTIWPIDHEDLYVYDLHPTDDDRYAHDGGWEAFDVVAERTPVAGGEDAALRLAFTRHGPVVHVDPEARVAVAVRAAWLQPGMAPYLASLGYQDAADTREFRDALARWGAPGVKQVFASVDGRIGVQACGRVPRRTGWDGALPVPGDGRFEWDGAVDAGDLPGEVDPASGWATTSNQADGPGEVVATTDWYSSARHERLSAWLGSGARVDVGSSLAMQTDATNVHARRLLDRLAAVGVPDDLRECWAELQAWDGVEGTDSRPALVVQLWLRRHWRPWLADRCLARLGVAADPAARARLVREDTLFSDLRPDLRMLTVVDPDRDDDRALLAEGLGATLRAALAEIEARLGPDRSGWTWGALHRTELRHPVLGPAGSLPPQPRAGSGDTVGLSGHDADFNAVMGSSFRMVLDVGDWDASRVVTAPGQSGDPRSEHYADLLGLWAQGGSFPLAYSRAAVEAVATARLVLTPLA